MNEASTISTKPAFVSFHTVKFFLPAIVLFVALTGLGVWRERAIGSPFAQTQEVSVSREIEERFGVRLMGVRLVAKGGLVDLRYRVIDAGKAKNFGHYTETSPLLIAEDSGHQVEVTIMGLHNHRVETGRVYYILYRNTGDVLKKGRPVTIQIGELKVEHFIVQ
ncbi:MAG: hypothetical protein H5T69_15790 [Chloroflexi bacterium]|nr:hypothetical protein [Chloroflexota bacterium]